jgi:hypothetical protein
MTNNFECLVVHVLFIHKHSKTKWSPTPKKCVFFDYDIFTIYEYRCYSLKHNQVFIYKDVKFHQFHMSFFPTTYGPTNCGPLLEEPNTIYYHSWSSTKAQLSTTSIETILKVNFHGLDHDQEVTQNLGDDPSFTTNFVHSWNRSPNVTTTFN